MQPTVNYMATILIPVKGNLYYLGEAIDSILSQTISNFKVLFIDDGADEHSLKWLLKYISKHDNFKVLKSPGNGISDALNFGIENSDTEYIIRMDSDDIMLEDRVEKQLEFMEFNSEIDIAGTQIRCFNYMGFVSDSSYPMSHSKIVEHLTYDNCIAHPTIILRRQSIIGKKLYDKFYDGIEDFELWSRLASQGIKFANLGEIKLYYRIHPTQFSDKSRDKTKILKRIKLLEQLVGKKFRPNSVLNLLEYEALLINECKEVAYNQYKTIICMNYLESILDGGFKSLRTDYSKKIKLYFVIVKISPRFAIKIIKLFITKMYNKIFIRLSHKIVYPKKQFHKSFYSLIRKVILDYRWRRILPMVIVKSIVVQAEKKSTNWKWIVGNKQKYFCYYDGEDWLHVWRNGGLVWNRPVNNAKDIVAADIDLFNLHYKPKKGDIVFDVGAGCGTSTLVYSQLVGKRGLVYAFEPSPYSIRRLQKLKKLFNLNNIRIFEISLSDCVGKKLLYLDDQLGTTDSFFDLKHKSSIEVFSTTLDEFINKLNISEINLAKINTEGAELLILMGMSKSYLKVKNLVVSCHDFIGDPRFKSQELVIQKLKEYNYELLPNTSTDPGVWISGYVFAKTRLV